MRIKVESYKIKCDGCGKTFESSEGYVCYCDEPNRIEDDASDSEWLIMSDGHHYCPDCYHWNDDDVCETKDGKKWNEDYEPIKDNQI